MHNYALPALNIRTGPDPTGRKRRENPSKSLLRPRLGLRLPGRARPARLDQAPTRPPRREGEAGAGDEQHDLPLGIVAMPGPKLFHA
jgi:hypothetical protein